MLHIVCSYIAIAQTTPDPGLPGTHTVIKAEYDLGDTAFKPPSFPNKVEVRGSVHYPADLNNGPFPVLFFLHGRHSTCYDTSLPSNTSLSWPCAIGYQSITSYEGYDYLANTMASHGYIVISISCNAINAADAGVPDLGMQGRAELLQHHFDLWHTYNTTGSFPFDTTFVGKLDMQNIGTMGHSRGGEGVIFNAQYNKSLGSPYGIKAVITLAPVDFWRHIMNKIPLMDVSPYCDGDVSDLEGVHFYDDSRYNDTTDQAPKHIVTFMGANHNFFNTVWTPGSYIAGGEDDWSYTDAQCGTIYATRFDTTKQKAAFNAYAAAFFRLYIGHETAFAPILEVKDIVPPASSELDSADVYVSYHPARIRRMDVNRTDSINSLIINTLRDTVKENGLTTPGLCGAPIMPGCLLGIQQPHAGGLGQMRLHWTDTTQSYVNEIPPAYRNLAGYDGIIFRTAVNHAEVAAGSKLNFRVQLIDTEGNISSVTVGNYTHAIYYEPGVASAKILFNSVRLPLSDFSGVNMSKIKYLKFLFDKSVIGSILISDLAFTSPVCGKLNAVFTDSITPGHNAFFTNTSAINTGDSLSWKWNFGDVLSGTNDSSNLQSPNHLYATKGTYTSCLYVLAYRKTGAVCTDTACTTFYIPGVGVPIQIEPSITISPNPVKDRLHITGLNAYATLSMINMYGQVVFTTSITSPDVYLPTLSPGVYYAVISLNATKVYKKLVVQ